MYLTCSDASNLGSDLAIGLALLSVEGGRAPWTIFNMKSASVLSPASLASTQVPSAPDCTAPL